MSAKIYYQEDCNLSLLEGKTIAIIGYGSQGHAHALNLKESGCHVIIGLYEGSRSWKRAQEQGFEVFTAAEAAKQADIIMILINDEKQAKLYKEDIEPNLEEGNMLMFAHGFNIHFGCIVPPANIDVTMIAPKAPGHTVRSEYQAGKGTPCLVAVQQDYTGKALDMALAYGLGIGGARAGLLETTYKTETETDLFGALCNVQAVFETEFKAFIIRLNITLAAEVEDTGFAAFKEIGCAEIAPDVDTLVNGELFIYRHDTQNDHAVNMGINSLHRIGLIKILDQKFFAQFFSRIAFHIIRIG